VVVLVGRTTTNETSPQRNSYPQVIQNHDETSSQRNSYPQVIQNHDDSYIATCLRYLPTSPTSRHCDNIPANPVWIADIFRCHFRISTSSSTVELVYSVSDNSQNLQN
jgi:hypothetical protein